MISQSVCSRATLSARRVGADSSNFPETQVRAQHISLACACTCLLCPCDLSHSVKYDDVPLGNVFGLTMRNCGNFPSSSDVTGSLPVHRVRFGHGTQHEKYTSYNNLHLDSRERSTFDEVDRHDLGEDAVADSVWKAAVACAARSPAKCSQSASIGDDQTEARRPVLP